MNRFDQTELEGKLFRGTVGNNHQVDYHDADIRIYMPAIKLLETLKDELIKKDYIICGGLIKKHVISSRELQAAILLNGEFANKPLWYRITHVIKNCPLSTPILLGEDEQELEVFSRMRRKPISSVIERQRYVRKKQRFNPSVYLPDHNNGKPKLISQVDPIDEIGTEMTDWIGDEANRYLDSII